MIDLRDDKAVVDKLARQRQRVISTEMGERLARELGAVRYVECSALTQRGLKNVFDEVRLILLTPTYYRLLWQPLLKLQLQARRSQNVSCCSHPFLMSST